jgi:hypothetical protein
MRRFILPVLLAVALLPTEARALTIRDVIELHRSGVGEEVLLALIEVDPSIFAIDSATIKTLKSAGLSERVIIAMIKSGRTQPPPATVAPAAAQPEPVAPQPQVVVVDHHDAEQPAPAVREVAVPVPVYIPVETRRRNHATIQRNGVDDPYGPLRHPPSTVTPVPPKKAEPQYWGFGGKLRPDAWQPAPDKANRPGTDGKRKGGGR